MDVTRISAVSYVNTYPFIYGLENYKFSENVELSYDIPSECAIKLLKEQSDVGLVPVSILPVLNYYEILSDYCIGQKVR